MRFIVLFMHFLFLCAPILSAAEKAGPAVKGFLDLSGFDFKHGGNITLSGEWEFYWDHLLSPTDFLTNTAGITLPSEIPHFIDVPNPWTIIATNNIRLPRDGKATYRLNVKLPGNISELTFQIPMMATRYSIWVNDKNIYSSSSNINSKDNYVPRYYPQLIEVPVHSNFMAITLQIVNYTYARGGQRNSITFGTEENIRNKRDFLLLIGSIPLGVFLLMGIFALSQIFITRRKIKTYLLTTLISLLAFVHTLFIGVTPNWFHNLDWNFYIRVIFITFYVIIPLWSALLFNMNRSIINHRMAYSVIYMGFFFSLLPLIAPSSIFIPARYTYYTLFLGISLYFIVALVIDLLKRKTLKNCIWIFSTLALFIALGHDGYYYMVWFMADYWLPYALTLFILTLPFIFFSDLKIDRNGQEILIDELNNLRFQQERLLRERETLEKKEQEYKAKSAAIEVKKSSFLSLFTQREKEIIQCLIQGDSYKEIAAHFSISEKTVNSHAQNIYQKAGVSGRGQLISLFLSITEGTEQKPL